LGYRVSSSRATQFRIWATRTLKQHLVEGYTLNQRRLHERGIEFEQAVQLLSRTLVNQQRVNAGGAAVLAVISDYARSWSLLQGYDEQSLGAAQQARDDANAAAGGCAGRHCRAEEDPDRQGRCHSALRPTARWWPDLGALATIEQGFGDELFYPNVASRAAHLLYFVIKNHPLADGNNRSGSFLFLWYLRINQHLLARPVEQLINDNTLVALALLVAESQPDQKALMIRLIEHFVLLKADRWGNNGWLQSHCRNQPLYRVG
jgi:prophage maintenance system killer protein